jgi:hypothetical protein
MPDNILIELQYFGPVTYFSAIAASQRVLLEQHEHYIKGSYRNRCHIASANGIQRLSVPLQKGKNEQQPIREVKIAYDEPWQKKHWQAIQSAYGKAPFFQHYVDLLMPLFQKRHCWLWDLNFKAFELTLSLLKHKAEIFFSQDWHAGPPDGLVDLRSRFRPGNRAEDSGLSSVYYPQVFEDRLGFLPNLSILDMIFCLGPGALQILAKSTNSQE